MPLQLSECRRLLEGVFCRPDLPEELRSKFTRWMLDHENDPMLRQAMLEIWSELPDNPEELSLDGLQRLLHHIDNGAAALSPTRRHRIATWMRRPIVAAAMTAAVFTAGWFASRLLTTTRESMAQEILLVTAPGSTGHHILPDGTEVWLNSDSRLTYTGDFNRADRKVKLSGEAYFEVARDTGRPFSVALDSLQVEVTGTAFDAINYPFAPVQIALRRGSVSIIGIGHDMAVAMEPDQIVTRRRGMTEISVTQTESENYCGWMARKLTFDNRRLADILTNIERRYAVSIDAAPGIDMEKRLSLTIGGETFEETARLLQLLLPIEIQSRGNNVTIRPSRRRS
ncbi:FecR family protein [uncultured Muribaculum sp.]|uniref:FecR family protein n=1 Tax=uncultured Muribaculum sp. TaxID=1918613 RepID=UPI0025D70DE2|nr:FecR domain-containing protein [uncultured Muribaculum sp.]